MPVSMNFNSLQQDIRSYIERGSSVDETVYAQIPKLINLAERAIATALKIEGFINIVTSDLNAGDSIYQKPNRWRSTVSMSFGIGDGQRRVQLFPRSYEYARTYWPTSGEVGVPKFYSEMSYTQWLITPTPDSSYPWEIVFYEQPAMLEDANQTNWLTDYLPNVLLYRSLLEAAPFLKNDDRIQTWKAFYDEGLASINAQDLQKVVDRNVTRKEA